MPEEIVIDSCSDEVDGAMEHFSQAKKSMTIVIDDTPDGPVQVRNSALPSSPLGGGGFDWGAKQSSLSDATQEDDDDDDDDAPIQGNSYAGSNGADNDSSIIVIEDTSSWVPDSYTGSFQEANASVLPKASSARKLNSESDRDVLISSSQRKKDNSQRAWNIPSSPVLARSSKKKRPSLEVLENPSHKKNKQLTSSIKKNCDLSDEFRLSSDDDFDTFLAKNMATGSIRKEMQTDENVPPERTPHTAMKATMLLSDQTSSTPAKPNPVPAKRTRTAPSDTARWKNKTAQEKQLERAELQRKKEEERLAKKLEREQQKNAIQLEKQRKRELEQANKLRKDKYEVAREMIMDVSGKLFDGEIGDGIKEGLSEHGMELKRWDKPISGTWHPIRMRRKVTSRYDVEEDIYKPCDLEVEKEDRAIVFIHASDFTTIIEESQLSEHIADIRSVFQSEHIVYIIQGLDSMARMVANAQNKAFTGRVREMLVDTDQIDQNSKLDSGTSIGKKKAGKTNSLQEAARVGISRERAEELIVRMQIEFGFKVIQTSSIPETANWIVELANAIGQIPYKTKKLLGNDIIDVGAIRSGKDSLDTFTKTMQQIKYVTPQLASIIGSVYPNVHHLMHKFTSSGSGALSGIQVEGSRRRPIGSALAGSIHSIFTSKNPDEFLEEK